MGKVVCVTGASGYIASWLVKLLLQRGYTVKATVRNLNDPRKVAHLKALEGGEERLQLYEANLVEEGCFDSIVEGCEGVFHTASPVFLLAEDPKKELIDPAVEVDETWHSDVAFCEENKEWYALSKTLAEEATWRFAEENGLDLVTLHPGFVVGPPLQPILGLTCGGFLDFIKEGKEVWPTGVYRYVDVRDVALAHILALENPSASGRYCLVGRVASSSQVLDILRHLFPSFNLPSIKTEKQASSPIYKVSQERAKSLGINFKPLELTIKDTVERFRENNLITF